MRSKSTVLHTFARFYLDFYMMWWIRWLNPYQLNHLRKTMTVSYMLMLYKYCAIHQITGSEAGLQFYIHFTDFCEFVVWCVVVDRGKRKKVTKRA